MKNFVDLKNYLIKEIKPQENYQYFIFKELINSGGKISYDKNTLKILRDLKFKQAYSVDNRDISMKDIQKSEYGHRSDIKPVESENKIND